MADGTATRAVGTPAGLRSAAVLSPGQTGELARIGLAIEKLYDEPMDIEWALAAGELSVVQARPITTPAARPAAGPGEQWNDSLAGDYLWSNGNVGERAQTTNPDATITGFPGAAGVVVGIARVLRTPEDAAQFGDGEILVTTVTNIGWTPTFLRAAAVVTDVGAPLSHAAIVARELGIPAVVGCGNATMFLHSGNRVRVDGSHGTVEVLHQEAARSVQRLTARAPRDHDHPGRCCPQAP